MNKFQWIKEKLSFFKINVVYKFYKVAEWIRNFLSLGFENCIIFTFFFLIRVILIIPAVVSFSIYYGIDKLVDIIHNKEQLIIDEHNN